MGEISLRSIRYESVRAVFELVAGRPGVSRAEISAETGLSLMTVGKVDDALREMGIIHQEKAVKSSAGRRASVLRLNPDLNVLILDLTSHPYTVYTMDMCARPVDTERYCSADRDIPERELVSFLEYAKRAADAYRGYENCIGVGIALPSSDKTLRETVMAAAEGIFGGKYTVAEHFVTASLRSVGDIISDFDEKTVLYLRVGEEIHSAISFRGEIPSVGGGVGFGDVISVDGLTLLERVRLTKTPEELASAIAQPLYNGICLTNPHGVVFDFAMPYSAEGTVEALCDILSKKFRLKADMVPELAVVREDSVPMLRGLTLHIRTEWLKKLIYGD